jgi:large repetitive protein
MERLARFIRSARLGLTLAVFASAAVAVSCGTDTGSLLTNPPSTIVVTTASLASGTVGTPYSQTLQASGGSAAYVWTVLSGTLPAGLTLSSAGSITGTPTAVVTAVLNLQVASGTSTATQVFILAVVAAQSQVGSASISITTSTLPGATLGVPYSQTLQTTGGSGSLAWSVLAGSLPTGLTLSNLGVLSGTPTLVGTSAITVLVTSGVATATQNLSVVVSATAATSVVVTTTSIPAGTIGTFYSQTLKATGGSGTFIWTVATGAIPSGLTLSSAGTLAGIPTGLAVDTFSVQAASGGAVATQSLVLTIGAQPLAIIPPGLAPIPQLATYSHALQATGGVGGYVWSVVAGALPAGIALSAGGLLNGSPTVVGPDTFTVQVASGTQTATLAIGMTIVVQPPLSATNLPLLDAIIGQPYHTNLVAAGGTGTYSWSVSAGALPAGIVLASNGSLTGVATTPGTTHPTFQVTSGAQTATQTMAFSAEPPLSITTVSFPIGQVGVAYNQAIVATGGNGIYLDSVVGGSLPTGLVLSGSSITGVPQLPGSFNFQIQVRSGTQITVQAYSVSMLPGNPLIITTQGLPGAYPNVPYVQGLAATGGSGTFVWTITSGTLPGLMSMNSGGVISGTPTGIATDTFTVQVSSGGQTASQVLTLTVSSAGVVKITTLLMASGHVGQNYSMQLLASGGGVYVWTLASGSLPAGLSLSASGLITGIPTTVQTPTFQVTVSSIGQVDSKSLTVSISP